MRIHELHVSDFKRIVVVDIKPGANVVEIAGKNAQGKTSTMDSIWALFGGKDAIPQDPVREGAEKAVLIADVGDYIVKRTIKPDRSTTISVSTKDGARFDKPQAILDDLIGKLSFDPLFLVRQKPAEQLETIKTFAPGVDFAALDAEEAQAESDRADANRLVKQLTAIVDSLRGVGELPPEVDTADILARLEAASERNGKIREYIGKRQAVELEIKSIVKMVADSEQELVALRERIAAEEARIAELTTKHTALQDKLAKAKPVPAFEDEAALREELREANEANQANAAANAKAAQAKVDRERLVAAEKAAAAGQKAVEAVRQKRTDALTAIKLPVKGLGVTGAGITFGGHPLANASFAQQLQLGIALAIKANPKLKVARILEGSMLDDDAMQTLHDMAAEHDFQVWIERVGSGSEGAIVIEEGEVKAAPVKKAKAAKS